MRHRRIAALGAALFALSAFPTIAAAHVSVHPNTVPAGAFATLNVRVPGEEEHAFAWKVAMKVPDGFISFDTENVPGWSAEVKTKKLSKPIETDDGPIDEEVSEIVWTGDKKEGKLEDGTFVQFPLSVAIPESYEGKSLAFKTLEYYSNGKVARWIGSPEAEEPAPTINVTAKGGLIEEVAGGEAGTSAAEAPGEGSAAAESPGASGGSGEMQMQMAGENASSDSGGGSDDTLAVIALIVGVLGLLVGGGALAIARRSTGVAR
jgi:periplasmic copper chaperone A